MKLETKSQHTPGPWRLENLAANGEQEIGISRSWDIGGSSVCVVESSRDCRTLLADARLIAAAPDLLEALKAMLAEFDPGGTLDPDLSVNIPRIAARAAIAAAEGIPA